MNLFGYVGGILNFIIIALAVFVFHSFSGQGNLTPGEFVQRIQIVCTSNT